MWNRLGISQKIGIAMGAVLFIIVILVGAAWLNLRTIGSSTSTVETRLQMTLDADTLVMRLIESGALTTAYAIKVSDSDLKAAQSGLDRLAESLAKVASTSADTSNATRAYETSSRTMISSIGERHSTNTEFDSAATALNTTCSALAYVLARENRPEMLPAGFKLYQISEIGTAQTMHYLANRDPADVATAKNAIAEFAPVVETLRTGAADSPRVQKILAALEPQIADFSKALDAMIASTDKIEVARAQRQTAVNSLIDSINDLRTSNTAEQSAAIVAMHQAMNVSMSIIGLLSLLAIVVVVLAGLFIVRKFIEGKQAQEKLDLRGSYLTAIIENQPGLLWLKDTEGRFLTVNHAFVRSCGREKLEEVVGKTDRAVWPSELAEKYQSDDNEVMTRRAPIDADERIIDQGVVKWFHTFKTPVFTTDGQVLGTCGFAVDITARKRTEEEQKVLEDRLQRAEKMEALGTLAGGVAHDLNNVLGIVVGFSELLLSDSGESSSARSKANEILKGAQRAAAIVQDLLTLARRGVSNTKVLNLDDIVLECGNSPEFAGISSYQPSTRITTDLEAHLLNISGSAVHLSKSLMNLVSNAAEAMPGGGVITIKTRNQYLDKPVSGYDEVCEGDYVVLSVSDMGEGIEASDLKRIFEPFYTKKVMGRSGTGLGLAVVWGTVKDHKGYINVESQEGKGTVFTLYFPVTREEISLEQVSVSAAEYMGKDESILVVDDVKEQRDLASTMLKKLNYTAISVSSGEEAVEYLKQNAVDLVVLDMIMDPGIDGLDTYARILEIQPHQRAIIVSGFSETERVSRAQALDAGAYVKKPYVLEKLGL
ncbi:MAG: ATP-binding protein, partial [Syntrophobacteraceae bacterium]